MGYQDEILAIRQQRAQRDIAEAQEAIQEKYQVAVQERDQQPLRVTPKQYEAWDREAEQLEDEWQAVSPPPPPQAPVLSEPTKRFVNERQAFNQRYGDQGEPSLPGGPRICRSEGIKTRHRRVFQILRRRAGHVRQGLRHAIRSVRESPASERGLRDAWPDLRRIQSATSKNAC